MFEPDPCVSLSKLFLSELSSQLVHIGGVELRLQIDVNMASAHLDRLGPFLSAGRSDWAVEVQVHIEDGPIAPRENPWGESAFVFSRTDLWFAVDRSRRRARAWIDRSRGAFEAVLELALQSTLLAHDGLVVHASCGVVDGKAWLMPGPSGTGKSTAARAGGFDRVLTDEMVIIRRSPAGYRAWGTPFWSEDRVLPFDTGSAPLGTLIRLVKSPTVAVSPLAEDDAAAYLLGCVALYETTPAARAAVFERVCDLVGQIDRQTLAFPKGGPWVDVAVHRMQARSLSTR